MIASASLAAFALVALGMVLTPGPNMIYLITRSIMQGRLAGFISLLGVILGFVFYMLCAAFGLTALLLAVPFAYAALQWAGAAYLLYMAWNAVKPGARSVLKPRSDLAADGPGKLFAMGFVTNLLATIHGATAEKGRFPRTTPARAANVWCSIAATSPTGAPASPTMASGSTGPGNPIVGDVT